MQGLAVGVVSADYDPASGRVGPEVCEYEGAWLYAPVSGTLIHNNVGHNWSGQAPSQAGDTIGLLIDLAEGSLTVFCNGALLGEAVQPKSPAPPAKERAPREWQETVEEGQPDKMCEVCGQYPAIYCQRTVAMSVSDATRRRWCGDCARDQTDAVFSPRPRASTERSLAITGPVRWCVDLGWEAGTVQVEAAPFAHLRDVSVPCFLGPKPKKPPH